MSFLASNWAWLLNEQGLPLPVKYSPNVLAGTAADIWEELAKKNDIGFTSEEKRILRAFCLRHDLAEAVPGIALPSLFLLRMGNQMLFSSGKAQMAIPVEDAHALLGQVGDIICGWMRPYADDETQALLDAWENRERNAKEILDSRMHLLARMERDSFHSLSQTISSQWNNSWNGAILQEGEMFAAARMCAGFVPFGQQIEILNAIRSCPASNTEKIDALGAVLGGSDAQFFVFGGLEAACEQGYALAGRLRKALDMKEETPLDPESFLREYGVRIQEMKWKDSPLDALSCWSSAHGPLILLNVAEGKRCSHEYGRRFTLAHELCHLLTDRTHALGLVDVLGGGMPRFIERRANAFAAEILLPQQLAVGELLRSNEKCEMFLLNLREKYKVSRKAAASQIFNSSIFSSLSSEEVEFFYKEVFNNQEDE